MRAARRTCARAACAASLAALTALILPIAPAAEAASRKVPPRFVGMMWDKEIQDAPAELQTAQWRTMAQSGVESARVIFSWNLAQDERQFKPNFVRADQMVRDAATHGIDILPVITYAPPWARVQPDNLGSAPADLRAYGHYVSELVRRYGPRGYYWRRNPDVPRRPIRTWQIWNEPSLEYQFSPHAGWPQRYAQVLRTGARAVRARDRGATIVLAGFANDAWRAIAKLYRAGNVRPYFDAAAVHMYSASPGDFVEVTRRFRQAMDRYGDRRKPIYITEVGASASAGAFASPGHEHFQVTRRGLARQIAPSFRALAGVRHRFRIERVYWYTWASPYQMPSGVFGYTGLNAFDGFAVGAEPALPAYRRMAAAYEGCRKDARARCVR
jgi:polysaccharide biosynthesis protein PslG